MSHEPSSINNRLINDLFDYILQVLDIPKKQNAFVEKEEVSLFLSFFALFPHFQWMFTGRY